MKENVGLLLSEEGDPVTKNMAKDKILNAFSASVFTSTSGIQVPETKTQVWSKNDLPLAGRTKLGRV